MKYVIILSALLFTSCKTSKEIQTKTYTETKSSNKEEIDTMRYLNSNRGYDSSNTSTYTKDTEIEEIEFETIVKNDSVIITVPKKIKKIKTTSRKITKEDIIATEIKSDSTKIVINRESSTEVVDKSDTKTKSKMSNSPLVRGIYLIGALLIGGYVVVKKYFPSIFVKITKSLKSIIK